MTSTNITNWGKFWRDRYAQIGCVLFVVTIAGDVLLGLLRKSGVIEWHPAVTFRELMAVQNEGILFFGLPVFIGFVFILIGAVRALR